MGLLLSILITCVGVLEVIACYTHFRLGVTYNECKTNIKHVARYYALELRKHELHFEPGPDDPGPSTSKDTLSQLLMKNKQNLNENIDDNSDQLKVNNGHVHPEIGSPNPAANLKVPRNSISGSGLDSPTVQKLLSPEVDITEAVEKIQHLDELRHASGLEVVRKDFWRSRSPSPFPESDSGVETKSPDLPESHRPPTNEIEERNYWNKSLESVDDSGFSKTDLEVQNITEKISRQPSPYPDVLFGITAENIDEETRFDEAFLRSLDGVKSSRCDDKRRSFRKKRNSSSTSSRASEISRSLTSLDDIDNIERLDMKKISPLTEEIEDKSDIFLEKCDSIISPIPEDTKEANVTNQEQTKFEAKVTPNTNSNSQEGKTNLSFTEKVKDLEISVQLLVTVKGTSQGDKMEYTTTVNPPKSQNEEKQLVKEEITKSTEEKSEFGNVKTSVTYGTGPNEDTTNLKDLQISSQSLIHSERTVQDDVSSSEAEFLKLYESFSELPDRQKDEFLNLIGQSKPEEVENEEIISEDDINEEVARITENIPKSILKKIPEIKEDNLDLPENLPKGTSEIIRSMSPFRSDEKIHITEITEITESTESVITIPPENQKNGESSDATIELLTSDKTIDSVQVPTKECDQDSVENKQVTIDMNTENKSESRIVSTEKIEQPILTNGNQTETKVVSTVTTKEPQVVRQLTSKPQKSSDESIKTIVENISENKAANKNTNNIDSQVFEQHVVEQIEQPDMKVSSITVAESTTFENIINKQQTPIQNEDVNISSTIVDETIKTTDEISNEKTKVSSVISEECTGITTVQQQEPLLRTNTEQQIIKLENVPNKNDINIVETATIIEQQVSSPNTFVQETIQQKTTTTEEKPLNNENNILEITTAITEQQISMPETIVQQITEQQTKTSKEDIPITNENIVQEITTVTTSVQDSIPKTVVEQKAEQQTTTLKEDMPVTNDNIVEDITTLTTIAPQNSIAATVVEQKINQQTTTVKEDIPVTDDNIVEEITTVTTTTVLQKSTPPITEQQTTTSKEKMPVMNDKIVEEITTVTTTVQQEFIPETQPEQIPVQNENTNTILEQTTTVSKISTPEVIQQQTPTQETKTPIEHTNSQQTNALPIPDEQSKPTTPTETKIETSKKETKPESSSESSSTPSTVIETQLRRASKTSFEDASPVQNQMMTRKLSNSDISPKQASQAFWLIFSAEYTNAMEKDWHGQHFSCWQCDESLTGQRYVLRDDHPYCVKCYEQVFANPCEKCNRIIGIDSKDLSYKDKHWHEACFQCTTCSESLVDKQFGAKGEKIYCGNCYDKQFASRCDGCGKIFHAGTKKMEYKNRQWHEQCFRCCKCETPIGTKSFIPREKDIYCAGCYEEKFATRCVKCDKAIQSGGVTYKNEPWHRECFTCTHCNKNLAGQRFTSRDDKPCCADCFGKLFAKRCTSCAEPITGIGGTRFISFEDRHWHNDCFICASCTTSLVGRGFITDEDKIICPECAKERFM